MNEIEKLKDCGTIKTYKQDEYIFHEGETGEEMYIVLSGRVNIYINSIQGLPILVSEIGPTDFFGEMSLLEDQFRNASVVAAADTSVLAIGKEKFQTFICGNPTMTYKIMRGLSRRIRNLDNELRKLSGQIRTIKPPDPDQGINQQAANIREVAEDVDIISNTEEPTPIPDFILFKNNSAELARDLFPSGHKNYPPVEANINDEYIFTKLVDCPVCGSVFNAKMQRLSKLQLSKVDYDFRKRYIEFEPLWYTIWVCPCCYYANFYSDFGILPSKTFKILSEKLNALKEGILFRFTEDRDINQVFTLYYLALFSANIYCKDPFKFAHLWMHLSWLYDDVSDFEMAAFCASKAIAYYLYILDNPKCHMTLENEIQTAIIVAELYAKLNDRENALQYYQIAADNRIHPGFNRQAVKRIREIRDMR